QLDRLVDVSPGCGDLAPAAHDVRENSWISLPCGVGLPPVKGFHRLVDPAELEQRFGVVVGPRAVASPEPPELERARMCPAEPLGAGGSVAAPGRHQPDDGQVIGRMETEVLLRELECPHRRLSRQVELTAMDRDPREGEMVLGYLEPVLDCDVA